jgi:cytochrome c oxidase cbb3-type subunit 2
MSLMSKHGAIERNVSLLMGGTLVVVLIGGIVEIVPLFYVKNTIEKVDGMRPYSPLELAGRNIYIREGCYVCHSQMIRPFRDEVERYGHYSLAAESMYDHPFQWGSKRTGPDLARVGGRYSDDWHVAHLKDPQSVVPDSIMPLLFIALFLGGVIYAFWPKNQESFDAAARSPLMDNDRPAEADQPASESASIKDKAHG